MLVARDASCNRGGGTGADFVDRKRQGLARDVQAAEKTT